MRDRITKGGVTVNVIAGTHVVYIGVDLAKKARADCKGFAVMREDHTENEKSWLRGIKTFESVLPHADSGTNVTSREHPFQSFQWGDYAAKPDHAYTYTVLPLYGRPKSLKEGTAVSVNIQTEPEWGKRHSVFFNRGAVASQEYSRRFQDRKPAEVGQAAYNWLSRGLIEALVSFIERAKDDTYTLHGAFYEFQWHTVLEALAKAKTRRATVKVVFDSIEGKTGPRTKNLEAIGKAGIKGICSERTEGKLMHNKFLILSKNGRPLAVWTGSTNITENGIFGHSNCAHVVESASVARAYLDYWTQLKADLTTPEMKEWTAENNPEPDAPWTEPLSCVFSAHSGSGILKRYAEVAATAKKGLFMTFAFGMNKMFKPIYEMDDDVLRFALMDREGNGANIAQAKIDIRRIRSRANVVIAVGNRIPTNSFDRWLKEVDRVVETVNVRWIHNKYMLVDPLSDDPVVITGSANFSNPSTSTNDENMLVIRGDTRVADIYLGEYMRLHAHYAFRDAIAIHKRQTGAVKTWQPSFLDETDGWLADYFTSGSARCRRREYFSGA